MSVATPLRNLLMAGIAALVLPSGLARAEGTLTHVGSLRHGDQQLDVDMFTENGQAVALISIAKTASGSPGAASHISLAVGPGEWSAFEALWTRGQAQMSGASSWSPVGAFQEEGTTDPTKLTVSAGPTVRLVLQSSQLGAFAFELRPEEAPGFEAALRTVETSFSEGALRLGEAGPS